jgi:apolipoprotein N-acyltransferase
MVAALASGVLLALSFPRYGHPAVAFIALVPLFVALSGWNGQPGKTPGVSPGRGFRLGLVAGFIHFAGTVYWTGATIQTFGGLPWVVAVLITALLVLYTATYVALASAASASRWHRPPGWRPSILGATCWAASRGFPSATR